MCVCVCHCICFRAPVPAHRNSVNNFVVCLLSFYRSLLFAAFCEIRVFISKSHSLCGRTCFFQLAYSFYDAPIYKHINVSYCHDLVFCEAYMTSLCDRTKQISPIWNCNLVFATSIHLLLPLNFLSTQAPYMRAPTFLPLVFIGCVRMCECASVRMRIQTC